MKVLFAVAECVPFIKTGGLADVAGALPKELKKVGIDARVVLPKYGLIAEKYRLAMKHLGSVGVKVGYRSVFCGVETLEYEGVTYYFIDNEYYFKRDSLYGHYDDGERFAFYNRAVLESFEITGFIPDVIHVHDWHTGMIPLMYQSDYKNRYKNIKTVMTIHNIQYQGIFDLNVLTNLCNISIENYYNGTTRFNDNVNFLKTGIVTCDYLTTVSETYANEIQEPQYGEGLDSVIRYRSGSLKGILNGIDYGLYNPQTDPEISYAYSKDNLKGKALNKERLQTYFNLPKNDRPLIGMVSRIASQKGFDILASVFDELMALDVQMVVLGSGDGYYENYFNAMTVKYPRKFKDYIGFNLKLAQMIYAGADYFLMPSQFEPCGLSQMIAMRYGTIPIVRETGGLKDTVTPFNEYDETGNGFSFTGYNGSDMLNVIKYALKVYDNKKWFNGLIQSAMDKDFSWNASAEKYADLYQNLIAK